MSVYVCKCRVPGKVYIKGSEFVEISYPNEISEIVSKVKVYSALKIYLSLTISYFSLHLSYTTLLVTSHLLPSISHVFLR